MTDQLDALPESVREAWRRMRYASDLTKGTVLSSTGDMETIFHDHVRLAASVQELERENGECRRNERDAIRRIAEQRERAERAEAELAVIKRRIAEAATGIAKRSLAPGCLVIEGFDDDPSDYHGERVALLPLDDEAKG